MFYNPALTIQQACDNITRKEIKLRRAVIYLLIPYMSLFHSSTKLIESEVQSISHGMVRFLSRVFAHTIAETVSIGSGINSDIEGTEGSVNLLTASYSQFSALIDELHNNMVAIFGFVAKLYIRNFKNKKEFINKYIKMHKYF